MDLDPRDSNLFRRFVPNWIRYRDIESLVNTQHCRSILLKKQPLGLHFCSMKCDNRINTVIYECKSSCLQTNIWGVMLPTFIITFLLQRVLFYHCQVCCHRVLVCNLTPIFRYHLEEEFKVTYFVDCSLFIGRVRGLQFFFQYRLGIPKFSFLRLTMIFLWKFIKVWKYSIPNSWCSEHDHLVVSLLTKKWS